MSSNKDNVDLMAPQWLFDADNESWIYVIPYPQGHDLRGRQYAYILGTVCQSGGNWIFRVSLGLRGVRGSLEAARLSVESNSEEQYKRMRPIILNRHKPTIQ